MRRLFVRGWWRPRRWALTKSVPADGIGGLVEAVTGDGWHVAQVVYAGWDARPRSDDLRGPRFAALMWSRRAEHARGAECR